MMIAAKLIAITTSQIHFFLLTKNKLRVCIQINCTVRDSLNFMYTLN